LLKKVAKYYKNTVTKYKTVPAREKKLFSDLRSSAWISFVPSSHPNRFRELSSRGNDMRDVKLTATYFLTTDHAKSRWNLPVLFNKATGQAYLPDEAFVAYESWPLLPATQVVNKMATWRNFSGEERLFIERFLEMYAQGPASSQKPRAERLSR